MRPWESGTIYKHRGCCDKIERIIISEDEVASKEWEVRREHVGRWNIQIWDERDEIRTDGPESS